MSSFRWTAAEVRRALDLPPQGGQDAGQGFARVWTDTRSLEPGDLFVALSGERFDAHAFLGQAAEAGARGAVVERVPDDAPNELVYFVVEDTLHALGRLGRHRRRALGARVVGVVGSNGKTTTKELIRAALEARYRVHATRGNLNNQVGVPLTLLAAPDDAEALVVEMGTNEPGEIEILTRIVEPDAAVVTSIGEEHLEKLGDLDGVLREETAILEGLGPEGVALVAEEPAVLPERARRLLGGGAELRVAGFSEHADLRPDGGAEGVRFEPEGGTRWAWNGVPVHLALPGRWNVRNALLALGLAERWGVPPTDAADAVGRVGATELRGQWHRYGELRVMADCYNSNPPSVRAAAELLASLPAPGRKLLVLGTMRELGESAAALHRDTARAVAERLGDGIDAVVATGQFVDAFRSLELTPDAPLLLEPDPLDALARLEATLQGTETLLLKASRGEALERWLPRLAERAEL